jgi:glycine cleavage system H protein
MKFTQSHEWIRIEEEVGVVGITNYAQQELGDIVYVELPFVGKVVKAGEEIAVLESTKAAADIYAPVSGEIIEINQKLVDYIHQINTSAEKEGWLFKMRLSDFSECQSLLDPDAYAQLVR